jgi:hypothetical protein
LGCEILASDTCRDESSCSRSIWEYLLPQLSHVIPAGNAAVAAFGAFYELRMMPKSTDRSNSAAATQSNIAILALQQDIASQSYGSVPLLLACVMLASAELMQRRQFNALIHLQGAFRILSASGKSRPRLRVTGGTFKQTPAPDIE